jgi:hypothetical protein
MSKTRITYELRVWLIAVTQNGVDLDKTSVDFELRPANLTISAIRRSRFDGLGYHSRFGATWSDVGAKQLVSEFVTGLHYGYGVLPESIRVNIVCSEGAYNERISKELVDLLTDLGCVAKRGQGTPRRQK